MAKTWLITGTSRGFGRELAKAVLAAGDNLVATARKTSSLDDLVQKYGSQIIPFPLDVTDVAQSRAAVAAAVDTFGRLGVVVNNAGYANVNSIEDTDEADFHAQVDTNLWGVVNVTRAALPVLREQGSGHIIQFASIGGRTGTPGLGPYQLSKWAVEGFSEVLAKEVAPFGVQVTIVEPGAFRTDWAAASMGIVENLHEAYEPTVGHMAARLRESSGSQPGDPKRAAKILVDIANDPDAPLHLLLGSNALAIARGVLEERRREDEKWAAVTESADFPK
jgi:NAD(P)-dependent dehydrogenase (short-subunit alcohol dehydrogenase family)